MEGENVVVMGGSFNPPTIAHLALIRAALAALDARAGYLAPVSHAYLKRKMVRAGEGHLCLPDAARLEMLRAMCAGDPKLHIYEGEMSEPFAVTERTMECVQRMYPGARIWFVIGADKLALLESFVWKWDFLYRFGAVVFARSGGDLERQLRDYPGLTAFRGSIAAVAPPEGVAQISSTAVRRHLFDVDAVADMLHPAVVPLVRRLRAEDFPEEILDFRGEWAFLGNGFPAALERDGIVYPSAEAAFQASKCDGDAEKRAFARMAPNAARQKGNMLQPGPDWDARKDGIMADIVSRKFRRDPALRRMLLDTGERRLINGGKKGGHWGVNLITWEGENRLGEILMRLRAALREEEQT